MPNDGRRPETGPMQFGKDWPGLFIRGDHAFQYFMSLEEAIARLKRSGSGDFVLDSVLAGLLSDLKSCRVMPGQTDPEATVQMLRAFGDCLP